MTTFAVRHGDRQLAGALERAIPLVAPDHPATAALSEMRNQAAGQTNTPATVPWRVRPVIAGALRQVAGDDPLGEQLRGLADGLEDSARARAVNS